MQLNIAIEHGQGRSEPLTAETLVNLYVEKAPTNAKSKVYLLGAPGLEYLATNGSGPCRGLTQMAGIAYQVSGALLYQVNSVGVGTLKGTVAIGTNAVSMANNGTQLVIVTNPLAYVYDSGLDTLTQITDPDFPGVATVDYIDGYFIFTTSDQTQFIISAILDGTDYDALDFASAESDPDPLVAVWVDHREILLFGTRTMEPWFNSGASDFPFERIPQAIAQKGIGSAMSIARSDNSTFWVDHEGVVRRLGSGYIPQRISTHAIEYALGDFSTAEAFSYVLEGHECYVLTTDKTFVYDSATKLWHRRRTLGEDRWRARGCVFCYGATYVGDFENGNVYLLSLDTYTDNGEPMSAEMVFPPVSNGGKRFTAHELFLDCETGVGPGHTDSPLRYSSMQSNTFQQNAFQVHGIVRETPVLVDPRVMLQTSRDGKTWSNQRTVSLGPLGEYQTQCRWRRLGQYTNLHSRILISDPVRRAIYTAYLEARGDD